MFHTERDSAVFMSEVLLLLGGSLTVVYTVAIMIALVRRAFSSLPALCTSFVISATASIPFVWALALQWPYLPELWDINPTAGLLPPINALLLCFVWMGPSIQYVHQCMRTAPGRRATSRTNQPTTGPRFDQP